MSGRLCRPQRPRPLHGRLRRGLGLRRPGFRPRPARGHRPSALSPRRPAQTLPPPRPLQRRLEAEATRNLEVIWLLRSLRPDFKTLADFRKDNRAAFKPLFKNFNLLCRKLDLFGAELVAIDGSKFKAVNNPRRHYTQEQLQELVQKVEARIDEYLGELDRQDTEAEGVPAAPSRTALEEKIAVLKARQGKYDELLAEMKAAQQTEVSLTDPDSRGMKKVAVGYNVPVAVDAKHHLIAAPEVVQAASDYGQLSPMATTAQAALAVTSLQVVADAGYHEAQQLEACAAAGLTTFVPARGTTRGQGPYNRAIHPKEAFTYDPVGDTYRCPAGQTLAQGYAGESRGKQCLYYYNVAACGACGAKGGLHHGRLSQTFAPGQRGRGRAAGPARAGASGAGAPAQGNRGTRLRDAPQLGPRHFSDERAGESAGRIQPELPDLQPATGAQPGGDGRAADGGGGGRTGRRGRRGLKRCGTSFFRPAVLPARITPSLRRPARTRWGENFSARQTLLPAPRRGENFG